MVTFAAPAADIHNVWWVWLLGGVVWFGVALLLGVLIGKSIRRADIRETAVAAPLNAAGPQLAPQTARRRTVPIPPIGLALLAIAVGLETVGYVVRLTGASGPSARLLSMDAPWSLPRLFVAALFAAAALAAVAGAGSIPGRRTWWVAVALVSGTIAAVKAGSTVHAVALHSLTDRLGSAGALAVSVLAAAAVVGGLWFLSRAERRDRRRVLGVLSLYAVASVGLSAASSGVAGAFGAASNWAAAATFLEESGEALAGVSFLVAVLVGVAPSLVLPAEWALRRAADEHTLTLPEQVPTRSAAESPTLG